MNFLPDLQLSWWNGWIFLAIFYFAFAVFLLTFSKPVVKKLYKVSGWEKYHYQLAAVGKLLTAASLILVVFSPIKFNTPLFWLGLMIYLTGFAVMFVGLLVFRTTPAGQPVRDGIYQYSRNPQWVGLAMIFLGTSISCGNGLALLLITTAVILFHYRLLGEESACLQEYGQPFQQYLDTVPRYFGLPRKQEK